LLSSPLKICGEVEIRVHQNLLSFAENLADINEVYSHSQSLAQCRQWLSKHLPHAIQTAVSSNAEAARLAASNLHTAAIAGIAAAEVYDLKNIEKNIEDEANNTTRFIIIGGQTSAPTGKDKTTLVVSTVNQAGALYKTLEPFATAGVDMLNIESRPSRQGLWDYVFFIDIEGHNEDINVADALTLLKNKVNMFKLLGSYPKAVF
jgi:chorismate mutase/prephenate dehydratase